MLGCIHLGDNKITYSGLIWLTRPDRCIRFVLGRMDRSRGSVGHASGEYADNVEYKRATKLPPIPWRQKANAFIPI